MRTTVDSVAAFPLDTPVLFTRIDQAISKAGTQGTLRKALEASVTGTFPVVVDTTYGEEIPIGMINAR